MPTPRRRPLGADHGGVLGAAVEVAAGLHAVAYHPDAVVLAGGREGWMTRSKLSRVCVSLPEVLTPKDLPLRTPGTNAPTLTVVLTR